jgi:hypothetical protein
VVSKIWEYIRSHNLQNPENRREILADDKLTKIFGTDKVTMFEMNKHLTRHRNKSAYPCTSMMTIHLQLSHSLHPDIFSFRRPSVSYRRSFLALMASVERKSPAPTDLRGIRFNLVTAILAP